MEEANYRRFLQATNTLIAFSFVLQGLVINHKTSVQSWVDVIFLGETTMKEIIPFSQEEQEAIKAIMLEYLTNCQLVILCSTEPHGFYTLKRKH